MGQQELGMCFVTFVPLFFHFHTVVLECVVDMKKKLYVATYTCIRVCASSLSFDCLSVTDLLM